MSVSHSLSGPPETRDGLSSCKDWWSVVVLGSAQKVPSYQWVDFGSGSEGTQGHRSCHNLKSGRSLRGYHAGPGGGTTCERMAECSEGLVGSVGTSRHAATVKRAAT